MTLRTWTTIAAVTAVAAAGATSAAAAPSGNFYGVCGTLSAKGTTYHVRTINVPCKTGRALVSKLLNMRRPGANVQFLGKYSGMGCVFVARGKAGILCTSASPFRQVSGARI
jgi:hypothetical protein